MSTLQDYEIRSQIERVLQYKVGVLQTPGLDVEFTHYLRNNSNAVLDVSRRGYVNGRVTKPDGTQRPLRQPTAQMKRLQRKLLTELETKFTLGECVSAKKGSSYVTSAKKHLGAKHILRADIKSFYDSVSAGKLSEIVKQYWPDHEDWIDVNIPFLFVAPNSGWNYKWSMTLLPTGSPTSPFLSNIVAKRLDDNMLALAAKYQATYTRYIDDMVLSFKQDLDPEEMNTIRLEVCKLIQAEGWTPHPRKTRWIDPASDRVVVTGVDLRRTEARVTTRYIKDKVKPMLDRAAQRIDTAGVSCLVDNQSDLLLPQFTSKRKSSDIKDLESLLPILFWHELPTLSYIKQVNPDQYKQCVEYLGKRINVRVSQWRYLKLGAWAHAALTPLLESDLNSQFNPMKFMDFNLSAVDNLVRVVRHYVELKERNSS